MIRFRDERGHLTVDIPEELDKMQNEVGAMFKRWCKSGMAPRDFLDFLSMIYD